MQMAQCDNTAFLQLQENITACCASEGSRENPICRAMTAGDIIYKRPIADMLEFINSYMTCREPLSPEQSQAAYDAFIAVTGWNPGYLQSIFTTLESQNENIALQSTIYLFAPIAIITLGIIWMMVGFGWMDWALAIYLTVLTLAILYICGLLYRINVENRLRSNGSAIRSQLAAANENLKQAIPMAIQGFFAMASAVSTIPPEKPWTCNPSTVCVSNARK